MKAFALIVLLSLTRADDTPAAVKKVQTDPKGAAGPSLHRPPETNIQKVESDPQILVKTDPKQGEQSLGDKSKDTCNKHLMGFYNLEGLDTPVTKVHQFCPHVTRSCCTASDEQRTAEMWMSEQEGVAEKYYENFLNSMKYLLGFSQEVLQLSLEFGENSDDRKEKPEQVQARLRRHLLQTRGRRLEDEEQGSSQEQVGEARF